MDFKAHITDKLTELTGLEKAAVEKAVETPPDEKLGDLAFPCFPLAKVLRKAPPLIAQELAAQLSSDELIDHVDAVGGYLNFFYDRRAFISDTVNACRAAGEDWGRSDMGSGKTVLVEMIQEYNLNGSDTGIQLSCEKPCRVIAGNTWKEQLVHIEESIVFIDEGNRFVSSEDFARTIRGSNNYYVRGDF